MSDAKPKHPVRQAAILVGGAGTRLGSLTATTPKPLIDVAGQPFLDWLLFDLGRQGFTDIVLLAGFATAAVEHFAATTPMQKRFGLSIRVAREASPAGTGGALANARSFLADRFLLLNGDSWLDTNLRTLAAETLPERGMVMAVRELPDAHRSGVVKLSGSRVTEFLPRPDAPGPGLVNAGVYLVDRALVDELPAHGSLENDVLPRLARENRLAAHGTTGYMIDIGVPDGLDEARREIPRRFRRGAVFLDRDGVLNEDRGHVGEVARFAWIAGAVHAVRRINDAGLYAFVVTNQAGVAKGFYTEADVAALHAHMSDALAAAGAHIDAFAYCPHHPEGTVPEYSRSCRCRKPEPGMITDLLSAWPVDAARSFLLGDKASDIAAASAAGIRAHLFSGPDLDAALEPLLQPADRG